jgi:hypothetical protein
MSSYSVAFRNDEFTEAFPSEPSIPIDGNNIIDDEIRTNAVAINTVKMLVEVCLKLVPEISKSL